MNITDVYQQARLSIAEVAGFIKAEFGKVQEEQVEEKEMNSLVSYVDQEAERKLVKALSDILPQATFITEEATVDTEESNLTWIIDPLDGTTNFLFGIPYFSVSVALEVNGEIQLGIVHDVMMNQQYHALKGEGAYCDDERIQVSQKKKIQDSVIISGFPYVNDYDVKAHTDLLQYWLLNTRGFRRNGSAALDLCAVAKGKSQVYYEGFLNLWDVAGGSIIVTEAGGVLSTYTGDTYDPRGGDVIATNPFLQSHVVEKVKSYLRS